MTAIVGRHEARVHMVTPKQAHGEIKRLLKQVAMTRDELQRRGDSWDLDADQRGVLADIQGLEFLLRRASVDR